MIPGHTSRINSSRETKLGAARTNTSKRSYDNLGSGMGSSARLTSWRPVSICKSLRMYFIGSGRHAEPPEHYGASTVRFAILLQRTGLPRGYLVIELIDMSAATSMCRRHLRCTKPLAKLHPLLGSLSCASGPVSVICESCVVPS